MCLTIGRTINGKTPEPKVNPWAETKAPTRVMNKSKNKTSIEFPEDEWAFHKVPKKELRYCAQWELARLCGKEQKPWRKLTDTAKRRFTFRDQASLHEVDAALGRFLEQWLKRKVPAVKVITLLVDFREDSYVLLELFKHWLESSPHRKRFRMNSPSRWHSLLARIVVVRATEAGLSREEAKAKTADLWKNWKLDNATEGILSAPHWSRALREARTLRKLLRANNGGFNFLICDPPYGCTKPNAPVGISLLEVPWGVGQRGKRVILSGL